MAHGSCLRRRPPLFMEATPDAVGRRLQNLSPSGAIAARRPARISDGSPGQRATSEQCRFCTVSPRPAFRSPAETTRYCESISGKTICRDIGAGRPQAPSRNSFRQVIKEAMNDAEDLLG